MATRKTTAAKARLASRAKAPAGPKAKATAPRPRPSTKAKPRPSTKAKPRPSTKAKPRPSMKAKATTRAKARPAKPRRSKATTARARRKTPRPGGAKRATAKAAKERFDGELLSQLVPHARRGDLHAILGIAAGREIRAALESPPDWGTGSYERLLALYLAGDVFEHPNVDGVIYDFAEHTYFRYDDEGMLLSQLNADLGAIHAVDRWGLFDEARAESYFRSALGGPYPEGVLEDLDAVLASPQRPLPRLAALRAAPPTDADADEPMRRIGPLDGDDSFDDG